MSLRLSERQQCLSLGAKPAGNGSRIMRRTTRVVSHGGNVFLQGAFCAALIYTYIYYNVYGNVCDAMGGINMRDKQIN